MFWDKPNMKATVTYLVLDNCSYPLSYLFLPIYANLQERLEIICLNPPPPFPPGHTHFHQKTCPSPINWLSFLLVCWSAIEWHEDENWHSSLCNATGFVNVWNHNQAETGSQEPSSERGRWHIFPWRASLTRRKQVMSKERMSPCIFHSYHGYPRLVISLWA